MIRCLCCNEFGEPNIRIVSQLLPNIHDRAPTRERVEILSCENCNSDLVEEVAACRTCGERPAACDDDCNSCAANFYVHNLGEFEEAFAILRRTSAGREVIRLVADAPTVHELARASCEAVRAGNLDAALTLLQQAIAARVAA